MNLKHSGLVYPIFLLPFDIPPRCLKFQIHLSCLGAIDYYIQSTLLHHEVLFPPNFCPSIASEFLLLLILLELYIPMILTKSLQGNEILGKHYLLSIFFLHACNFIYGYARAFETVIAIDLSLKSASKSK